jgi:hypothetical protein
MLRRHAALKAARRINAGHAPVHRVRNQIEYRPAKLRRRNRYRLGQRITCRAGAPVVFDRFGWLHDASRSLRRPISP